MLVRNTTILGIPILLIQYLGRYVGSLVVCGVFFTKFPIRSAIRSFGSVVITVEVREVHMSTVPVLPGTVTHKSARLKVETHMFGG